MKEENNMKNWQKPEMNLVELKNTNGGTSVLSNESTVLVDKTYAVISKTL